MLEYILAPLVGAAVGYYAGKKIAQKRRGPLTTDKQITRDFSVASLKAHDPDLAAYGLDWKELFNATNLLLAYQTLCDKMGSVGVITSGGRPQRHKDYVSILRAKKYKAAQWSQHNEWAALDCQWPTLEETAQAWNFAKMMPEFRQIIFTVTRKDDGSLRQYLHLSVNDPFRPDVPVVRLVDSDVFTESQIFDLYKIRTDQTS